MQGTYEMLKQVLRGDEDKYDDLTLLKEYKDKLSPNILAHFYCKNYKMICGLCKLYPLITEDDKSSICLQVLDKCLQTYDETKSVKIMTYFMKCLRNELIEHQHHKLGVDRFNTITIYVEEYPEIDSGEDLLDSCIGDDFILYYGLSEKEVLLCRLINDGYTIKDISKRVGLTTRAVYKNISKIKEKFLKFGAKSC